jgi:hypothetical protein
MESPRIIYVQQPAPQGNALGTAGLVLAIISLFLGWIPVLGWLLWFLAALFSFLGLFRMPQGRAIAGLIISCLTLIEIFVAISLFKGLISLFSFPFFI